jgi:hypothetical protein
MSSLDFRFSVASTVTANTVTAVASSLRDANVATAAAFFSLISSFFSALSYTDACALCALFLSFKITKLY